MMGRCRGLYIMVPKSSGMRDCDQKKAPVDEHDKLEREFEHKPRDVRAVAYRMLGSLAVGRDDVQEAWCGLSDPRE